MKIFAFYLPQFHEIPENNAWWGEGFTEWTNVKGAKSLYDGHIQPKKPLNNNYYNLMDKDTVKWQTELLQKYGLDGMIYYHYYFCGRLLLEKPAENLLKWKDIKQPFFFCWANHSWVRSWNGTREVLLLQEYGEKSNWENHINYLMPFFKDPRYEKKDNKPVFMVFKTDFDEKKEMFDYFEKQCIENGFDGIYIIENCVPLEGDNYQKFCKNISRQTERIFMREPDISRLIFRSKCPKLYRIVGMYIDSLLNKLHFKCKIKKYDGNQLYDIMLQEEYYADNIIHGIFFEWDNTPRHSYRGFVISPCKKEKFMEYMDSRKGDEYIFVNAWNEWAEGMVLEPTEDRGYEYLEWIKEWKKDLKSD